MRNSLPNTPGAIIGYRRNGSPIRLIAGGAASETLPPLGTPPESPPPVPPPAAPTQTFTVEDIERARREERDKLYGRLTNTGEKLKTLEEEMQVLRQEREARLTAESDARKQAEDLARQKDQDELSAKELLSKREQEWEAKQEQLRREMETRMAILQKEAEFSQLKAYIQKRLAEERGEIEENLIDLVTGNNEQEVDASIALMKERSKRILENAKQAFGQQRSQMPGVSSAAGGSIDPAANPGGQQLTDEDIRKMGWKDYAKFRDQHGIGGTSSNYGIYG